MSTIIYGLPELPVLSLGLWCNVMVLFYDAMAWDYGVGYGFWRLGIRLAIFF